MAHPQGRNAIGRAQGTDGDYPLVAPSPDVQHLLADLLLAIEPVLSDGSLVQPPFHITHLHGFDDSDTRACLISDDQGRPVFDTQGSDVVYRTGDYHGRLRIHEWSSVAQGYLRVVEHTEWKTGQTPVIYAPDIYPENAVINAEATELAPIASHGLDSNARKQRLVFKNGNNFELVPQRDSQDVGTPTTLVARARRGAGLGTRQCTSPVGQGGLSINGVSPGEDGNVFIGGDDADCYAVYIPGNFNGNANNEWNVQMNVLEVRNDCRPCPSCDDFVRAKKAVDHSYNRVREGAGIVVAVRDRYTQLNSQLAERTATLSGQPWSGRIRAGLDGVTYILFRYFVPPGMENGVGPISVGVSVSLGSGATAPGWSVIPASMYRTYSPLAAEADVYPKLASASPIALPGSVTWDRVYPGVGAAFDMCVQPTGAVESPGEEFEVRVTLSVTIAGQPTTSQTYVANSTHSTTE